MHHTYMYIIAMCIRIKNICIILTCIRVKDQGTQINASYMHASGSRIMDKCITHIRLLESPCSFVRPSGTKFQPHHTHMRYSQGLRMTDASYINASCTYASCTCIMIKEHICICIVQTCIMYICIRVKVSPCMKNLPHHTCIQCTHICHYQR